MFITLRDLRIKTYGQCYRLARKDGQRWNTIGYYDTIADAIEGLFDQLQLSDNKEIHIEKSTAKTIRHALELLEKRLEQYKEEIIQALQILTEENKK